MALVRLDNSAWGFESSCFVCEPSNSAGLRIPFFHDQEDDAVVADFTLGERFSGAPRYVHGGVTLAVLDEAMAWAAIALAGTFALTRTTSTRFRRPVAVDRPYRVEAHLQGRTDGGELEMVAVVVDEDGRPCVEASATLVPMDAARATDAIGAIEGDDASFVRG